MVVCCCGLDSSLWTLKEKIHKLLETTFAVIDAIGYYQIDKESTTRSSYFCDLMELSKFSIHFIAESERVVGCIDKLTQSSL